MDKYGLETGKKSAPIEILFWPFLYKQDSKTLRIFSNLELRTGSDHISGDFGAGVEISTVQGAFDRQSWRMETRITFESHHFIEIREIFTYLHCPRRRCLPSWRTSCVWRCWCWCCCLVRRPSPSRRPAHRHLQCPLRPGKYENHIFLLNGVIFLILILVNKPTSLIWLFNYLMNCSISDLECLLK